MLNTLTTQVKVTLPDELYFYVKSRAEKFGLNLASYLRNLIINDVRDVEIPEFKISAKTEKTALDALVQYQTGKTKTIPAASGESQKTNPASEGKFQTPVFKTA